MRSRSWNVFRGRLILALKFGSVLMLFLVSVLVVACGNTSATAGLGSPPVTLTINLNQTFSSPTPTLPPYSCAAWVTQNSPAYYQNSVIEVYAKYVQNVNGNPAGMSGAHAQATVLWPAGAPTTVAVNTSSDGLAVFPVSLQPDAVGHVVLVEVSFTSLDGQHTCNVSGSQDAFFTPIFVSPTASPSSTDTPTDTPTGSPSVPPNGG